LGCEFQTLEWPISAFSFLLLFFSAAAREGDRDEEA
jgi:hypothetical protein